MNHNFFKKLEALEYKYIQTTEQLSSEEILNNMELYRKYNQEIAELEGIVLLFRAYKKAQEELDALQFILADSDLKELAQEEYKYLSQEIERLEESIKISLLPKDANDDSNIFIEIRAGTGGNESALFAADLFRMYSRFSERQGWLTEIISSSDSDMGGYKEIILRVVGKGAYSFLKFESGTHRVQRVPVTESQGRIHTSACTVAILPEVAAIEEVDINPADLRIDTYRASGAGGQHVNKTDSAVRITHIPSGVVVECQDERSQHKNRAKALSLLAARILNIQQSEQQAEQAARRKSLVGSGDRSERIRTYNFPQGRMTDHRINLTLYKLDFIMDGDISDLIQKLNTEHNAQMLSESQDE